MLSKRKRTLAMVITTHAHTHRNNIDNKMTSNKWKTNKILYENHKNDYDDDADDRTENKSSQSVSFPPAHAADIITTFACETYWMVKHTNTLHKYGNGYDK